MEIINDYIKWKLDNPDEDYQYDEIHNFLGNYSRSSLQGLLELCLKLKNAVGFSEEYFDRNSNVGGTSSEEFIHWKVCNDALVKCNG